jgi:hypothetical protein
MMLGVFAVMPHLVAGGISVCGREAFAGCTRCPDVFKCMALAERCLQCHRLKHSELKNYSMIITTNSGRSFDSDRDLTAPERHILQKLFIWVSFASSRDEFRRKKEEALLKGWNNSGPVEESEALRTIIADLEEKVSLRLPDKIEMVTG